VVAIAQVSLAIMAVHYQLLVYCKDSILFIMLWL